MKQKIVLGIGGSSGSIYAKLLMDYFQQQDNVELGVVMSDNAKINWKLELGEWSDDLYPFKFYRKNDFFAPFASGSAGYTSMVICPSSMGLASRIVSGISDDLITRSADVIIKEKRQLIIVPRETPMSLIHLRNLTTLAEAGATIIPAIPSFYSNPQSIEEVAMTVVSRIIDHLGLHQETYRWGD